MNLHRSFSLVFLLLLSALPVAAQEWDPVKSATGWASFDRDGSCVFHNLAARKLLVWSRDTGVSGEVDLAKLQAPPSKWVLDSSGNAWVVAGTSLQLVDKKGKLGTSFNLPAEVADLAWDARSFLLCYRTRDPYLESRDMRTGTILWSAGTKPAKGETFGPARHHAVIREDGKALLCSGADFQLDVLDMAKGTKVETLAFTYKGQPAPLLNLGESDRGAMAWWLNNNIAILAVPASQLPPGEFQGLMLAKLDLAKKEMTFLPTGVDERAILVGIQEDSAVVRLPAGGLSYFPIN